MADQSEPCVEGRGRWLEHWCALPTSLKSALHGVARRPAMAGLWIATAHEVRKYVTDLPVTIPGATRGFSRRRTSSLAQEDFHGNVWGGSPSKGLRIWTPDGRIVRAGHSADGLSPQITCLFEDRERNVLVGTDGAGTARFKPHPFTAWFGQLGGLAGAMIDSIGEDPPGRMLIGTEGSGLRHVGGGAPPVRSSPRQMARWGASGGSRRCCARMMAR